MSINLTIIDDFLPLKKFKEIYNNISFLEWKHDYNYIADLDKLSSDDYDASHLWYSNGPLSPQDFLLFKNTLRKKLNKKIVHCRLNSWTWVNTKKPMPHIDYVKNECEYQLLFYIRSDEGINGGTAFYRKDERGFEIDTHIGFKENRAIFFKSKDCLHSPLLWNAKSATGRYSAIFQLVVEDILK